MSKPSKPSSATPKDSSASSSSSPISGSPRAVSAPALKKGSSDTSGAPSRLPILTTGAGSGQEDPTSPGSTSRDALASPSAVLSNPTSPTAASVIPQSNRLADIDELGNTSGFFAQDAIDYSIPDDPSNLLLHEDGSIRAGSLPKIVQRLTSLDSQVSMLFDFLITYRSYATPRYLLALLRRRFEQVVEGEDIKVVRLKTALFMRQWIEKTASDFVDDESLVEAMSRFISSWEVIDPSTQRTASVCQAALMKAVDSKDAAGRNTAEKVFAVPPPESELPTESDPARLQFTSVSTLEMARQWTLMEWKFWEAIKPTEFLNLAWTRKNKDEIAPNIVTLTKNFNRAAGWVATMIQRATVQKERVKIMSKMIDLADELRNLGNFSGLMEVLSGLGSASVYRLKSTWELLPPKQTETYADLKSLMSPDLSFKKYREHLKNVNPPTIPYLGISLTDLTFIYEGSRDYSNDKLVNFTKSRMVSEILKTISQYQDASYNLAVVPVIRDYMLSPTIWDDNTLYSYSLWNEPRPGTEPSFEPPVIVYLEGGPSARTSMILNASTIDSIINAKPKIIKEPPKEWKSSSLVIRRGILRAADLHHAILHLLYINESDPQYIQFGNVFFNAIKQFGGLDKVLTTFEAILADAPASDDLIPPTASQTFLASAASISPRSGSKKSETLTISITPTLPVSEGLQKSQSASSVSSPRSFSSNHSADSDSDTQNILKPRRKMSSELLSLDLSSSPANTPPSRKKSRRSLRDDLSSGTDTSSEEEVDSLDGRPPSPRSQSATLRPGKALKHRRASTNLADLMEEAHSKASKDTLRDSTEFATMTDPYWPPKTHAELARTMLDICINWGARYTSMSGPSRESKPLQLLPAWMESKLSQVDGMRESVQTAVTSFVKALASGPPDPARHNANIPPPKTYPVPSIPSAQQTIRMYHPEEIARQLAIWHQSEFANFTRDELFALSSYASSTLSLPSTAATRSTYSILKALSEQLYDWVKNELTPLSEKTKKKTLAPIVELFTDVLHYSIELNSFLAARSVYRALDKCVISDKSTFDSDAVSKKTKESLNKFVALFTNGFGFVWNQRIASTQMSTSEPPMVLPIEWLESAIAHNQTEKDWYVLSKFGSRALTFYFCVGY